MNSFWQGFIVASVLWALLIMVSTGGWILGRQSV